MLRVVPAVVALLLFVAPAAQALLPAPVSAQESRALDVSGLDAPVEIRVDHWGIPHIYAETEHDLFFAQGWNAARDRLFQLELWRRQATGTVAEILGERELERDIGTRLFLFRGDLEQELRHYHPRGVEIVGAFVEGINAYVAATEADPALLPVEFELLGITPGRWTPEVVISRHQGLLGNIGAELRTGRAVARVGPEAVREVESFGPGEPVLELDPTIDGEALFQDILGIYDAFRDGIDFLPEDIVPEHRGREEAFLRLETAAAPPEWRAAESVGSNNWVVDGTRSQSRSPVMANDPHRVQAAPSLRYWVHLVGPGWNVIGGGEPSLPGVSIGHNGHGAWGLTVFRTDGEDLMVYETHPDDPELYRFRGRWERMSTLTEEIPVRGQAARTATLRYTRHGPVVFRDEARNTAYAVRAAWMEVGGAPYLASLRMDQATTWEEFVEACTWSNIPGENMVWADRDGTIGWQAVGIAPVRRGFSGLVPVPGDGRYEWDGYLPIQAKPHVVNPLQGYFATANNEVIPRDYEFMDAVGFDWSDPYRWARVVEVLGNGRRHSMLDMMRLQTDELAIPARELVPLLRDLPADDARVEEARGRLLDWDFVMDAESVPAGIFVAWQGAVWDRVDARLVPEGAEGLLGTSLARMIQAVAVPPGGWGSDPLAERDALLLDALAEAVAELTDKLGGDMDGWRWGQEDYHHATLRHPLGRVVDEEMRERLEVGPHPRGGYGWTVNQTGSGDNQTAGASFRIIVDTGDWDATVGMNTPGQAGDPDSPFYENLFERWARDEFHPVFYSRGKVEEATALRLELRPGER